MVPYLCDAPHSVNPLFLVVVVVLPSRVVGTFWPFHHKHAPNQMQKGLACLDTGCSVVCLLF